MSTITPTYVYTEMTPNPATMKFVADRMIIGPGDVAEFESAEQAKGASAMAEGLFGMSFVKGVFVMSNFVTVTKAEGVEWEMVKNELREHIQRYLMENELAVSDDFKSEPMTSEEDVATISGTHLITNELDEKIAGILDEYVKPAVERDGGAIHFKRFDQGVVTVALKGACSGCPSSTVTLKSGIENLLTSMLPEVKEVVAEQD